MGEPLVDEYMTKVAPRIEPAAVEQEVTGLICGVKVRGRIDVLDVSGRINDAKMEGKKPAGISSNYRVQVATYAKLHAQASGSVRLNTFTKTNMIQVVEQPFAVAEPDLIQLERMYPLAQDAIRSGLYLPNRNLNLCSRKYCASWCHCERDYGGVIHQE